ncbi:hypothetical protein L7F22_022395 [Adiantum nelumboides]|nr:hypothetical protein [Adiantum nelumboides]
MFTLDVNIPEVNAVMFAHGSSVVADIEIWHKRIGHANVQRLKTMQSQELVTGLPVFKVADMKKVCEACQFGKQAKASFPHNKHVSINALELIHSYVWGPAKTVSMGGCRFYVTFIDDHTRKVWVYFMKEKSEVFTHFQNFKAMAEKQTGKYVQCLRSDGGGEYFSNEFSSFLKKHGIQRQFTCRTPAAAVHNVTPEEKFSGKKLDLGHLKVFGCIAYVHVLDELRTNLDPKTEKCIFIGYSLEQNGYKCYNSITRHVRVSEDVVFYEMASWYADLKHDIGADVMIKVVTKNADPSSQVLSGLQGSSSASAVDKPWSGRLRERESPVSSTNVSQKGKEKVDDIPQIPNLSAGFDDENLSGSEHSLDEEFGVPFVRTPGVKKALQGMHEKLRRSRRHKNLVDILTYDSYVARHCAYMAKIVQDKEPTCFDEAIGNMKWEQAMDEEMAALDVNETWELVPLPESKKSIGCKWVYKVKHNADGSISRYKARLVAKGYAQTYGIDYEETFSKILFWFCVILFSSGSLKLVTNSVLVLVIDFCILFFANYQVSSYWLVDSTRLVSGFVHYNWFLVQNSGSGLEFWFSSLYSDLWVVTGSVQAEGINMGDAIEEDEEEEFLQRNEIVIPIFEDWLVFGYWLETADFWLVSGCGYWLETADSGLVRLEVPVQDWLVQEQMVAVSFLVL